MQLVLAALSVLLGRAQAHLAGPLSAALGSTVQQLAAAGQQQVLQPALAVSGWALVEGLHAFVKRVNECCLCMVGRRQLCEGGMLGSSGSL
jgi:hypothetical protein